MLPFDAERRRRLLVGQQPQHLHPQRRRRERPVRLPLRGHASRSRFQLTFAGPAARRHAASTSTSARCRSSASRTTRPTAASACTASTSARASTASAPTPQHPFVVRNLKIWDVALRLPPAGAVAAGREPDASTSAVYGVYHPNYDHHVYRNVTISETNTEPFNRGHDDLSVQYGPLTVDGLTFERIRSGGSMPLIQISDDNPTGTAVSHFRNVKVVELDRHSKRTVAGEPRRRPAAAAEDAARACRSTCTTTSARAGTRKVVSTRSAGVQAATARALPRRAAADRRRVARGRGEGRRVPEAARPGRRPAADDRHHARPPRRAASCSFAAPTTDNGTVKEVSVNGVSAKALAANFAEWEAIVLLAKATTTDGSLQLSAHAVDQAGNTEPRAHVVAVTSEK